MTDNPKKHISWDELCDYLEGELPDERLLQIDTHLAVCNQCAREARTAYGLERACGDWTAQEHALALLRARLASALDQAAESGRLTESLQERLRRWPRLGRALAEAAARVVFADAVRLATDGLEGLIRLGPQVELTPAAVPARGGAPMPASETAGNRVRVVGHIVADVSADEATRSIAVRAYLPSPAAPPLVLLVPDALNVMPSIREVTRVPGTDYFVAEFKDVEPGGYTVVFEPSSRTAQPA